MRSPPPCQASVYSCENGLLKDNARIVLHPDEAGEVKPCVEGKYGKWRVGAQATTTAVFPKGKGPEDAKEEVRA